MKLRKFKYVIDEEGLDDFGASGMVFRVTSLVKGKIYTQEDTTYYDENGRNAKPFFVDDNGCARDIEDSLRAGIIIEIK